MAVGMNWNTLMALCLNMVSAIGIVFLNKLVYVRYQFPSMTLTLVHFVVTAAGLQVFSWLGLFKPKRLNILRVAPLSASFCGFVVFANLSLQFNTVGTYQLAKAMTTPVILFIQTVFYRKKSSVAIKLTVVSCGIAFPYSWVKMLVVAVFREIFATGREGGGKLVSRVGKTH